MKIVVIADGKHQQEFQDKSIPEGVQVQFVTSIADAKPDADAYFHLLASEHVVKDIEHIRQLQAPVFVKADAANATSLPSHCVRVNDWHEFFFSDVIAVEASEEHKSAVASIFNHLQWKFNPVEPARN